VSYFTIGHNNFTRVEASFFGASYVIIKFVESVYLNNFRLSLDTLGIKIRSALTSLIYRKVLKINLSQLDISVGKIISLITRDVNEFDSYVTYSTLLWCHLLQLLITCYAINTEIGLLVLIIVIIVCIIILIQGK
jgi:ATP-binding cassette subfamily C (CFTR/MRP) protein 4